MQSGANGLWFGNGHVLVRVAQADNADGLSVLEHRLPFDDAPPLHVHHEEDEVLYLLDGELRLRVGGEVLTVGAGDMLLAPRGIPHGHRVLSPGGARLLTVTRGGSEAMVRAASRLASAVVLPEPVAPTPEAQASLAALCAAHGIELLGPPID